MQQALQLHHYLKCDLQDHEITADSLYFILRQHVILHLN